MHLVQNVAIFNQVGSPLVFVLLSNKLTIQVEGLYQLAQQIAKKHGEDLGVRKTSLGGFLIVVSRPLYVVNFEDGDDQKILSRNVQYRVQIGLKEGRRWR